MTVTLAPVNGQLQTSPGVSLTDRSLLKSPLPKLQRRLQPAATTPGSSSLIQGLSWVMRRTRQREANGWLVIPDSACTDAPGVTVRPWSSCTKRTGTSEPSISTFITVPSVAPPPRRALSVMGPPFQSKSVAYTLPLLRV